MDKCIGIDLSTTCSSVAVWQYGKVEVIANDQGNRATPSFVSFTDEEYLLGEAAKNQVAIDPCNTIFEIKRFIGCRFDDVEIQQDQRYWPFKLINVCGKVMIEVKCRGQVRVFTPEEVSALILIKMKESAEAYLGFPVKNAVITVPAYFSDVQREATKTAGLLAGLNVIRILKEPTAAALAYGLHKWRKEQRNIFVFDLGGGTFDVSILSVSAGSQFEVLATAGNAHLGGEDFDNRLVSYVIDEFKRKNKKDISNNACVLYRIRCAVEKAKCNLSVSTEAVIEIDAIYEGIDMHLKVTRAKFESLCFDLFKKIIIAVEQVLVDAALNRDDIHDVLLVGGSTKMPKIKQILQKLFVDKLENSSVMNPEEAVVSGAAIQAALLCGETDVKINNFLLIDIAPLSLGIEIAGGVMSRVIQRGAKIPCKKTEVFTTFTHNQSLVTIQVFEGERSLTKDNKLIGIFNLTGIPLLPCGVPKVEVTFNLDANGILHIKAKEVGSGVSHEIKINNRLGGKLFQSDINQMVTEAKQCKKSDEECRMKIEARNKLEKFVYHVLEALVEYEHKLKYHTRMKVKAECANCLQWLQKHQYARIKEVEDKYNYLVYLCSQCST